MIVYPAIDLRGGKVVRLVRGDPEAETVFSDDPVKVAQKWISEGAEWLHVVNLDGSLSGIDSAGSFTNLDAVGAIASQGIPVQFGGGLRSEDDVARAFDLGVERVVVGTAAAENPDMMGRLVEKYGVDAVGVALDSRDEYVATHGWQQQTNLTPVGLGREVYKRGVRVALYTDINRDGELTGVNVEATEELARETGLSVIASGGVKGLHDVLALRDTGVVTGVVIGTALYTNVLSLAELMRLLNQWTDEEESADAE